MSSINNGQTIQNPAINKKVIKIKYYKKHTLSDKGKKISISLTNWLKT